MNFNILDYTNLQYNSIKHSTNSINNGTNPKLVDNGVKLFFKEVLYFKKN
jgi:hypothetical protein